MKAMVCEMCGSNEFIKQDGLYVCQHCSTQYTVEEARKLMVDVSGSTVKIDNSAFVQKYLENARRAKQKEDWEETEKYYNLVEQNDPSNIEAIFYSAYGKAKSALIENDIFKREAAFKVLQNCVSIVDDNFDVENEEENKKIIAQISDDIISMASSNYVFTQTTTTQNGVKNTTDDRYKTVNLFNELGIEYMTTLENIAKKLPSDKKNHRNYYYILATKQGIYLLKNGGNVLGAKRQVVKDKITAYTALIKETDLSYSQPEFPPDPEQKGCCVVATAVYGSYDCPQVWTLRRYRDDTLAKTWYGRAFIHTYYAIGPTLVKWFGNTAWFKNMWKPKLDRMVSNLNAEGVEDTPYEDKKW